MMLIEIQELLLTSPKMVARMFEKVLLYVLPEYRDDSAYATLSA